MKKFILFCFVSVLLILCVSCSESLGSRQVQLVFPVHPWEKQSTAKMWYTLKWTDGASVKSKHISSDIRKTFITVNPGETVVVCAYPLDRLNPLGALISPQDKRTVISLDETQGWFAGLLMNVDRDVSACINPQIIFDRAAQITDDARNLDSITLVRDILNGKLSDDSFETLEKITAGPFVVQNGLWISENINDPSFSVTENTIPAFKIPKGTYCWYCQKLELELVITSDGTSAPVSSTRRTKMT